MNITVVTGHLSRPPARRALPSGDEIVSFDVTVEGPEARAEAVPVVWPSAPPSATALEAGSAVVVVGRVRRRFFRTAQGTQSRTEVVAARVVPARRAAAARRLVAGAVEALAEGADDFLAPARRPAGRPAGAVPADDVVASA